ncbi:MAG: metallophosphoesterase family protein [Desulfurococcaceae archaeon]|jgi:predicted phosphodiesterase
MIIYATSDIHSPLYTPLFIEALNRTSGTPDIFLLVGDLVEKNNVMAFKQIYEALKRKFPSTAIVAVFGNEEYRGYEKLYETLYKDVTWLNDNYVALRDKELCIVGTRGGLDKPTTWQAKHMPGIERYYRELPFKIVNMCRELRKSGCKKILLASHYGVTDKNLVGEDPKTYPYLACTAFSKLISREVVDLVIHGHIHLGRLERVEVNGVPVYNVALPARKKIVELEI